MATFILPLLKVVGLLLTAFFSLAETFRDKTADTVITGPQRRRWSVAAIVSSLALAVTAEAIDAFTKERDATAAAEKTLRIIGDLDRSLHPIYPIKIPLRLKADLGASVFAAYRNRLLGAIPSDSTKVWPSLSPSSSIFPAPSEQAARVLLTADPQVRVFLYRRAKSDAPLAEFEPALSFTIESSYSSDAAQSARARQPGRSNSHF